MEPQFTTCPEPGCESAASIEGEALWSSTNGGVLMAKVVGACGHWFVMPSVDVDLASLADGVQIAS